ncbi:hypothetical protein QN277_008896 [Acacia crassicarpa]|uniref:Uncharacterized protein n=1 Tax=Acacia crassicarpa TaxID=499986 RepID=A0AAE1ITU6_9FABA|nr:hypothetical protein QN277_008896 [Acacia crassicarpa]
MFCFLRRIVASRRQISTSTFQQLLCVQNQWLPSTARYWNSISSSGYSFTVSYLIDACGLSPEEAASASRYVRFESREKSDLVINFLKNLGFSKSQIIRFTREAPQCLRYDPEKTLLPKIEFFISRGVSSSEIPKLLCSCPNIMRRSLDKQLIPSFDFFRDLFQSDDQFIKSLTYFPRIILHTSTLVVPNMKLLKEVGVPQSNIIKLLQLYPRTFTESPSKFNAIVEQVQEMGVDPSKYQFIMAIYALSSQSKATWSKKANVYKKWGWSDDDIVAAFRRCPFCMKISEGKIDATMELLVDKLGCPPSTIPNYAVVLSLSLNKRIVPRASIFQVLLSKGLVKKKSLFSIFVCTERVFLNRFILSHGEEGSELLKLYQAKLDVAG